MIAALHRSRSGRQGAARHIIISAAGFDHRLLAHHAFTFDTMLRAAAISNGPATGQQLHRFRSTIFDANMICPEPASSVRLRLFRQEADRNADGDVAGTLKEGEKRKHSCQNTTSKIGRAWGKDRVGQYV